MTSSTPSGWPEKRNASVPERVAPHASIAEALDRASERLAAAGLPSARREATSLWAVVAGKKPGDVWLSREESPPPQLVERFGEAVARRSRGVPFAYAVGCVGFRTLELALDPRALIPRPETEGLVDLVLQWARPGAQAPGAGDRGIAADIGTGCGCIALALAVEGAFERVIAVERSAAAAALARENVALVRPRVPVDIREGDLLAPLAGTPCRAIVANPPYLTAAEYAALDAAVRDFEPREAQENREPAREQVEQYDRALQSVQSNAVYQQVVAAQANFEKLMAKVNARIYEGKKQGAASPIITLG